MAKNKDDFLIIAEIGTAHEGNLQKAFMLIDAAFEAGANCVKFQWVKAKEILHPLCGGVDLPAGRLDLYKQFCNLEVSPVFFEKIKAYTKEKGLKFCCSVFGKQSLEQLLKIEPDYIKIASPELNHLPLLRQLSRLNPHNKTPVILSTGVSKLSDIEKALDIVGRQNITLLHCITCYPAPETQYNLNVLESLNKVFGVCVGTSDHSKDSVLVPVLSVACGAVAIEKHITLDTNANGLDDKIALTQEQFLIMSMAIKQALSLRRHFTGFIKQGDTGLLQQQLSLLAKQQIIKQMIFQYGRQKVLKVLGNGIKTLAKSEKQNYKTTNRSLHYMRDIKAGETLKKSDIGVLRTEKNLSFGVAPDYLFLVAGKKLMHDVKNAEGVQLQDFMQKGK